MYDERQWRRGLDMGKGDSNMWVNTSYYCFKSVISLLNHHIIVKMMSVSFKIKCNIFIKLFEIAQNFRNLHVFKNNPVPFR